jgi:hypothetical protein
LECWLELCVKLYQDTYVADRMKLENTVHSAVLDKHLGQNHHIYQDSFYDSVQLAQNVIRLKYKSMWHCEG